MFSCCGFGFLKWIFLERCLGSVFLGVSRVWGSRFGRG